MCAPIGLVTVRCMVRSVITLFLVLAFTFCADMGCGSSNINSVTLAWEPSPSGKVAGYMIYVGRASGDYYRTYDVGNELTYTLKNLGQGTYYIACTAYNASGKESTYSNEVHIRFD